MWNFFSSKKYEMGIVLIGVFVFVSFFFLQFLLFELLSILLTSLTLLNSDLRLGRLARKQRSLALQNMPLTLTCSDYCVNPKACRDINLRPPISYTCNNAPISYV